MDCLFRAFITKREPFPSSSKTHCGGRIFVDIEVCSLYPLRCCPDLGENVMELSVLRGFGYTLSGFEAHEIISWVKWDFPFPAVRTLNFCLQFNVVENSIINKCSEHQKFFKLICFELMNLRRYLLIAGDTTSW